MSCSATKWCAAVTIDSLEAAFGFEGLNTACEEPVNFAFLQRNGSPPGRRARNWPTGERHAQRQTLEINSGDVLSCRSPTPAGFTARITDLTTGQTGFMVASAANGFMDTNCKTCAGIPHTFHAEYSTASQQNQVPWAALEGGVLMQQETGHFESCNSVSNALPQSRTAAPSATRASSRPARAVRRGRRPSARARAAPPPGCASTPPRRASRARSPARPTTRQRPAVRVLRRSCFTRAQVGDHQRQVGQGTAIVAGCEDNFFQNGDLDWDGTELPATGWPDGSANHPTRSATSGRSPGRQALPAGPVRDERARLGVAVQHRYRQGLRGQAAGLELLPVLDAEQQETLRGVRTARAPACGTSGTSSRGHQAELRRDAQYGSPDLARFGGTDPARCSPTPRCPRTARGSTCRRH